MRCPRVFALLVTFASAALPACSLQGATASVDPSPTSPEEPAPVVTTPPPAKTTKTAPTPAPAPAVDDGTFAEAVYVFMRKKDRSTWMCTGTLVGARTVVTAAHCLDPAEFVAYEIVAGLAPGRPRVAARTPRVFGGSYEDVANPDIGTLVLDAPVVLPRYAELTDVASRVEAGEALSVAAVVRTEETAEAPLEKTSSMPLSSAVPLGYEHGFATPLFSKGGDSGAGLFLVEDGKMTHKLVGVARQPEPERELDHFTRIDAAFLAFYAAP